MRNERSQAAGFLRQGAAGLALAIGLAAAGPTDAASDMHRHGSGRLDIVVEGDAAMLELRVPGADIVGFEGEPRTPQDVTALAEAREILARGDRLFAFPDAAGCRLETGDADRQPLDDRGKESETETHGDFFARHVFRCERPQRATRIEVRLFEHFPAIQELEARIISPNGQTTHDLDRTSALLSF